MLETIYAAVLPEMKLNGIEDTVENRIAFLTGLNDAWKEDPSRSVIKKLYILRLSLEIKRLKIELFTTK